MRFLDSSRILPLSLLGLCLILFTASATTDLALPGPHALDDEAVHAAQAVDLLRPKYPYGRYTLHLGNQPFPFGISLHAGSLKAYMLWPLFSLFGPSIELERLFTIILGLLTLVVGYSFLLQQFGPWAALCATALLSLDSSFIFYSKLDQTIVEELLWIFSSLLFFGRFARTQRRRDLGMGCLSGILGVYSHITFIWFAAASFFAALLFYRDALSRLCKKPALSLFFPSTICFSVLFLYWLLGHRALLVQSPPGFSGAFVMFERLSTLGGILPDVLTGHYTKTFSVPEIEARPLTDFFLIGSLLFLLFACFENKKVRFFTFLEGMMFLLLCLTPMSSEQFITHRMMPFYVPLVLLGGVALAESMKALWHFRVQAVGKVFASFAVLFLAVASVYGQLSLKQEADRKIRETGGKGFWSDAIYSVASFLSQEKWEKTIYLNRECPSLVVLTRGEVPLETVSWRLVEDDRENRENLTRLILGISPETLLLLGPMAVASSHDLREVVQENKRELKSERTFHDREGEPVYVAYTVRTSDRSYDF